MSTHIPLNDIRVATPCNALWDNMQGNDTVRFCQTCSKNVYNLSKMSRVEAEALVQEKEGKLCVRFYRRADGTLLTDNCPIGLRAVRRQLSWLGAGIAALAASGIAIFSGGAGRSAPAMQPRPTLPFSTLRDVQPIKTVMDLVRPVQQPPLMGEICPPPPAPTPSPTPRAKPSS
jgi:hypothetical protein